MPAEFKDQGCGRRSLRAPRRDRRRGATAWSSAAGTARPGRTSRSSACTRRSRSIRRVRARMEREARAMGALAGTSAVRIISLQGDQQRALPRDGAPARQEPGQLPSRDGCRTGKKLSVERLFELFAPIINTPRSRAQHGHRAPRSQAREHLRHRRVRMRRRSPSGFWSRQGPEGRRPSPRTARSPARRATSRPKAGPGGPNELDHRIDVYTIGVVIFRALSGKVPFQSKKMYDLILSVTRGPRPSLHALRPRSPTGGRQVGREGARELP